MIIDEMASMLYINHVVRYPLFIAKQPFFGRTCARLCQSLPLASLSFNIFAPNQTFARAPIVHQYSTFLFLRVH